MTLNPDLKRLLLLPIKFLFSPVYFLLCVFAVLIEPGSPEQNIWLLRENMRDYWRGTSS